MATEIYKKHEPTFVFSPPTPLTNEFYKNNNTQNLEQACKILLSAYNEFNVKNTPMGNELSKILANPKKVPDAQAMFGISKEKKDAIYSVKVTTENETKIFSLRVGKDFTEISFMKNDELVERHLQKGKEVVNEVFA